MKTTRVLLASLSAICLLSACDEEEEIRPRPPAISSNQIDRIGRAGINTATINTFASTPQGRAAAEDDYNRDADVAGYVARYTPVISASLRVFDGFDRRCGNQFLAGPAGPTRYDTFATVLADDRLFVNTANAACNTYLAVEATAVGVPGLAGDCGGRTPNFDTLLLTESILVLGTFTGIDDGVGVVDLDGGTADLTQFPFMRDPL